MLICDQTVTLVKHIKGNDSDTYTKTVIKGVSWYAKTAVTVSDKGAVTANVYKIRIPAANMPTGVIPGKGDYLVRGELSASITTPGDLEAIEHTKISSVSDNRRGQLQHWAVTGV